MMATTDIRENVRERYGKIAERSGSCCGGANDAATEMGRRVGYEASDLEGVPEGANLGLGCGNPVALAALRKGDTVLDLGSGAGFDCFLASKNVGPEGRVIGVDMTPEMLSKARANAEKGGYTNVEFREGTIEALPVENNSVDVVISNCVINLSPDKSAVFSEINRVLRPGGRFFVSDLVLLNELPDVLRSSVELYAACIAGAMQKDSYLAAMAEAGLQEIRIAKETAYPVNLFAQDSAVRALAEEHGLSDGDLESAANSVVSVQVEGSKGVGPGLSCCGGAC